MSTTQFEHKGRTFYVYNSHRFPARFQWSVVTGGQDICGQYQGYKTVEEAREEARKFIDSYYEMSNLR